MAALGKLDPRRMQTASVSLGVAVIWCLGETLCWGQCSLDAPIQYDLILLGHILKYPVSKLNTQLGIQIPNFQIGFSLPTWMQIPSQ